MEADIVEDDDVTRRQCRRKLRFDPCFEDAAVHRCIDDPWRSQAIGSQTRNEGLGFPVTERGIGGKTAAFGRPSRTLCQAGIRRSLIDKDQPRQRLVEERLPAIDP